MREKEKCRKGNVQYFCMYTAGFLAAALLLLLIFAKEHASFTKMVDGVAQHYAVLMWIRNTLRQFLHEILHCRWLIFRLDRGLM